MLATCCKRSSPTTGGATLPRPLIELEDLTLNSLGTVKGTLPTYKAAERTRLAVRYGNQGKQVVQEKLTEKLESLGYNGDGGASPALSSRRSLSPGR